MPKGYLYLSNGMKFEGEQLGAPVTSAGELVFTTGMVGYTQTLTDPSFFGQILVFTYPLLGNYGVPSQVLQETLVAETGFESHRIHASGVIVSSASEQAFHWRSSHSLDEWLKNQGIPGLTGMDTRRLTQTIRNSSCLTAVLSSNPNLIYNSDLMRSTAPVLSHVSVKKRRFLGKGSKRMR